MVVDHAAKLTDLPDEQMSEILPALKKLAKAYVSEISEGTADDDVGF